MFHKTHKNISMYKQHIREWRQKIQQFAKTHPTNRKEFKEKWLIWVNHHNILYETEKQRLTKIRCKGDLDDKIFKSARYYYRKKKTENKSFTTRKSYEGFSKNIRNMMKNHIIYIVSQYENIRPMEAYDDFCKTQTQNIYNEIKLFLRQSAKKIEPYPFAIQFRKSYKNHFYKIRNNA